MLSLNRHVPGQIAHKKCSLVMTYQKRCQIPSEMGKSWLVGNILSLVSNIIIHGILHTHLSSARLLFYPTEKNVGGSAYLQRFDKFCLDLCQVLKQFSIFSNIGLIKFKHIK
jgi:hypothetical protein